SDTKNRIQLGKQRLEEKLAEINLKPNSRIFRKLLPAYEVSTKDELYSKIGSEIISLDGLKKILKRNTTRKWIRYWELQLTSRNSTRARRNEKHEEGTPKDSGQQKFNPKEPFVIKDDIDDHEPNYQMAKCCGPIPGDDVIGYRNGSDQVIIHQSKCQVAVKLLSSQEEKIIPVKWTTHKILAFHTRIFISGFDKFGIYNRITTVITKDFNVNMRSINLGSHDGIFEGTVDLYIHNANDLNNLILNLMKIKGIDTVKRSEVMEEV
ncbi:MAG: bifunctional (p)ppGpp synthetase/guanosine-3',5'-bis(diphosphate) 3'-pyrophosphohydrolase, partial [Bacteroidales bacterium]|nr:bifunctional (p)ppGpp synthetase/guanosine-3',5'-bis(diphosphate) 3'-pyrophosphohydrolase [Bacteroidales bacterium]